MKVTGLLIIGLCATIASAEPVAPGHWPQFRGPDRDLVSPDTGLLTEWPEGGPPLVWKAEGLGQGYATISLVDGMIYTQGHFGDEEKVVAIDDATGEVAWAVTVGPAKHVDQPGARCTPAVDEGRLYVETVGGGVVCLDADTREVIWRRHLVEDYGGVMSGWGFSESLLVDSRLVICKPGAADATLIALDKHSGETVWKGVFPGNESARYSSTIAIDVGGRRQYVQYLAGGVMGFDAADGRLLWSEDSSANVNANITAPVYRDGYLFSASSYGAGGALVHLTPSADGTDVSRVYHTKQMKNHHGGFVVVDGYIYGTDESVLTCLDFMTGEVAWEDRSVGKGAILYADGHLYLRSEGGTIALIEATAEGYREKGRFNPPHRSDKPKWTYPVVTGRRLYLRDHDVLLCYDVAAGE